MNLSAVFTLTSIVGERAELWDGYRRRLECVAGGRLAGGWFEWSGEAALPPIQIPWKGAPEMRADQEIGFLKYVRAWGSPPIASTR